MQLALKNIHIANGLLWSVRQHGDFPFDGHKKVPWRSTNLIGDLFLAKRLTNAGGQALLNLSSMFDIGTKPDACMFSIQLHFKMQRRSLLIQ